MLSHSSQSPYVKVLALRESDNAEVAYQWGMADHELQPNTSHKGGEEQLLAWLKQQSENVTLILPGEEVIIRAVAYSEHEKRHFTQMLPYQLEDDIIDDVEQLHFAIGLKGADKATIAYVDELWFARIRQTIMNAGLYVDRCFADFQLIAVDPQQLSLWFSDNRLQVHSVSGEGFTCDVSMAPVLLAAFLQTVNNEIELAVFIQHSVDSDAGNSIVNMINTVAPDRESHFYHQSPLLSCRHKQIVNFCVGPYGKTLSQSQWVKEFRGIAILAFVAFLAFFSVNGFDIYRLNQKNQLLEQEINRLTRTVIPEGIINDPVRQLRNKLGKTGNTNNEPSQLVYLLSIVSPLIHQLNIDLSGVNYSNKDRQMGLNVQADSFNTVEQLRTNITARGFEAELLSSNAIDDKFQARLRVKLP